MFGCLAGGKFSGKCKRAVKRVKKRIDVIGKKKQAVVRFLKKDVADLLDAGHDSNAFGRMDALIYEINKTSCYEMIENFCEIILNQLPSLQKQRECPQGALEVVSTLIFAAARFPDLPELCDLRHVFTERYGDHMESSVNVEFIERNQKAFSKEKKLHMMHSIAEEFSVKWDSWTFQDKLSASPEVKCEPPTKVVPFHSSNNKLSASPEAKCEPHTKVVPFHSSNDASRQLLAKGRKETSPKNSYEPNPKNVAERQAQAEPKNNYVISTASRVQLHATVEKTKKVISTEMENVEPYQMNTILYSFDNPRNNQKENYGNDHPKKISRNGTGKLQELDPSGCEKQGICTNESWNENSVPPHNNSNRSKDRCQVTEKCTNAGWLGHTEKEMQPIAVLNHRNSTVNMVPPYVKPSINDSSVHDDRKFEMPNSAAHGKRCGIYDDQNENFFDGRTIKSNSFQRQSKKFIVAEINGREVEIKDNAVHEEKHARQTSREEWHTIIESADSYTGFHDDGRTRNRHPRENNNYEMDNQRRYKSKHSDYEMDKRRRHTSRQRQTSGEELDIQEETMIMRWKRHQREPSGDEMDYCRRHRSKQRETNDDEMDSQRRYKSRQRQTSYDELSIQEETMIMRWINNASGEYYDERKARTRHRKETTDDETEYCRRSTSRERETNDDEMDYQIRYKSKRSAGNGEYYDEGEARIRHQMEPIDGNMYHRGRHASKHTGTNDDYYDGGNARTRPPTEWTDDEVDHAMDCGVAYLVNRQGRGRKTLNAAIYDEYDEEEIVVDRLLSHSSCFNAVRLAKP